MPPGNRKMSSLAVLRHRYALSQEGLGKLVGISKNTISAMEAGEMEDPQHIRRWERVAAELHVPISAIYTVPERYRFLFESRASVDPAKSAWRGPEQKGRNAGRALAAIIAQEDEADDDTDTDDTDDTDADESTDVDMRIVADELETRIAPEASIEIRQQVVGVLSDSSTSLYELEALIFVTAVTHCQSAMSTYTMRPEDYRGRLAALHRALDDADRYARATWLVDESVGEPQLVPDHRPDWREQSAYFQSASRWLSVHGPTILSWARVGPQWDLGLTELYEERTADAPDLRRQLQLLWDLTEDEFDDAKWSDRPGRRGKSKEISEDGVDQDADTVVSDDDDTT